MKIPENANPYRVIVNGVEHAYEAGEETTVAPGVEELINAADNFPPAAEEVQPPFAGGGGGGGVLMIGSTVQNEIVTLNKTLSEIFNAAKAGNFCVIYFDSEEIVSYMYVDFVDLGGYVYAIHYNPNGSSYLTFHADTPNDYPSAVMP